MKVKTSELIGAALDWAVAKCEGFMQGQIAIDGVTQGFYSPSTNWAQGGPITDQIPGYQLKVWLESGSSGKCEAHIHNYEGNWIAFGPTQLITAMRCYVASKLGDEVDVPEELIKGTK